MDVAPLELGLRPPLTLALTLAISSKMDIQPLDLG